MIKNNTALTRQSSTQVPCASELPCQSPIRRVPGSDWPSLRVGAIRDAL
jgi:hypothetical protein